MAGHYLYSDTQLADAISRSVRQRGLYCADSVAGALECSSTVVRLRLRSVLPLLPADVRAIIASGARAPNAAKRTPLPALARAVAAQVREDGCYIGARVAKRLDLTDKAVLRRVPELLASGLLDPATAAALGPDAPRSKMRRRISDYRFVDMIVAWVRERGRAPTYVEVAKTLCCHKVTAHKRYPFVVPLMPEDVRAVVEGHRRQHRAITDPGRRRPPNTPGSQRARYGVGDVVEALRTLAARGLPLRAAPLSRVLGCGIETASRLLGRVLPRLVTLDPDLSLEVAGLGPCPHPPWSPEREALLRERLSRGLPGFHSRDARGEADLPPAPAPPPAEDDDEEAAPGRPRTRTGYSPRRAAPRQPRVFRSRAAGM